MLDSLIYIEKYDKESGYFLADFLTEKGYWSFSQQLYKPGDIEYKDERTMIEIGELRCEQRHPYEGCIYEIPHEFLKMEWEKEPPSDLGGDFSNTISFRARHAVVSTLGY